MKKKTKFTIDSLLSRDDIHQLVEDLNTKQSELDKIVMVILNRDGNASIGMAGFDNNFEAIGALTVGINLIMGDDDGADE
jgi:hypothetical protein